MNKEERRTLEIKITEIVSSTVSSDYTGYILGQKDIVSKKTLMDDIIQNVLETSAWEEEGYYNEDDIRLAVGRELMTKITQKHESVDRLELLLLKAIVAWYDDSLIEYHGLDDEEFVNRVCERTSLTEAEYKDLMLTVK